MDWASVGCATLPEMAAHYIGEMKAIQPHGPYRLLGDSFGGLVAFEMALQLQSLGEPVEFLGLVDSNPPNWPPEGSADAAQMELASSPEPNNWIEALNLRVAETHRRARRNYVLDSRLDRNRFRGELTYFLCTGEPVVAGQDCRRSVAVVRCRRISAVAAAGPAWRVRSWPTRSALQNLLRACLSGEPLTESDPATVFDRAYRIENRAQGESIVNSTGEAYRIEQNGIRGDVDTFMADAQGVQFGGWAIEDRQRQPAQTIAVFLGDRFLGYGACGISRPDVVKRLAANSALYSGFHFIFQRGASAGVMERPRLFVLSSDGRAAELPFALSKKQ